MQPLLVRRRRMLTLIASPPSRVDFSSRKCMIKDAIANKRAIANSRPQHVSDFVVINLRDNTDGGLFPSSSGFTLAVHARLSQITRQQTCAGERELPGKRAARHRASRARHYQVHDLSDDNPGEVGGFLCDELMRGILGISLLRENPGRRSPLHHGVLCERVLASNAIECVYRLS
jgi:hypothetical protein